MRLALNAIVRSIGYLAVALSVVAIGIGRSVPHVPETRTAAAPRFYGIGGAAFTPPRSAMAILDAGRGVLHPAPLAADQTFDMAACSPWVGADGSFAMIGRMLDGAGGRLDALRLDAAGGLRRGLAVSPCTSIEIEPVVSGRPCWLPRWPGRLVIPAGDGQLYTVALGPEAVADAGRSSSVGGLGAEPEALARPLRWACTPPGDGLPILCDPIAPDVAALNGRLIVNLSRARTVDDRSVFGPSELWWLEIDPDRSLILDAGRFQHDDDLGPDDTLRGDERLANVAVAPDGSIAMAFLRRAHGESPYHLMVAPLKLGRDAWRVGPAVEVGFDVVVATPALSPDGRWVYPIARLTHGALPCVERRSVVDALGRSRLAAAGGWRPPAS